MAQQSPRWPKTDLKQPKMAQDGAKMAPRKPRDGSETGRRRFKREPGHLRQPRQHRRRQEGAERVQNRHNTVKAAARTTK